MKGHRNQLGGALRGQGWTISASKYIMILADYISLDKVRNHASRVIETNR